MGPHTTPVYHGDRGDEVRGLLGLLLQPGCRMCVHSLLAGQLPQNEFELGVLEGLRDQSLGTRVQLRCVLEIGTDDVWDVVGSTPDVSRRIQILADLGSSPTVKPTLLRYLWGLSSQRSAGLFRSVPPCHTVAGHHPFSESMLPRSPRGPNPRRGTRRDRDIIRKRAFR